MKKGLVSVLFISMNHEKYVEQGARSVLNQTWPDVEVLFVDNNSKDRTFELADELFRQSGLPYKGHKRKENYGISANLNFLLKQAEGEFIAVLSGDDWWREDNLALKAQYLDAHPACGLVYSNGYKYFQLEDRSHLFYETEQKTGHLFDDLLKGNLFFAVSVVSRHSSLLEIGNFDEGLLIEDWDLHLRMAKKFEIGYIHQPTCYSRITGNNLSSNIAFINKGYEQYIKKYGQYPEMKTAYRNNKMSQAFQLAQYAPSWKSFGYILKNIQFRPRYIWQLFRCLGGMVGIRQSIKS